MKFSEYLWKQINPIYEKIVNHPFNRELANGVLREERFVFYMQQDSAFLVEFSKALAIIASRVSSISLMNHLLHFSLETLNGERELHSYFVNPYPNIPIEPSPACMAYTHYLIATAATSSIEESLAAILPCFWIYREVGKSLIKGTNNKNPYSLWIDTYSSKEFSDATNLAIAIVDEVAVHSSKVQLERIGAAFEHCALFEWHFWNDAYLMKTFRNIHI